MTTLYKKVGRRYVPVQDTDACVGLTNGSWLVTVQDGLHKIRKPVDDVEGIKRLASITRYLEDWIALELIKLSAYKYGNNNKPLSAKEKRAYKAYTEIMGENAVLWMTKDSAYGVASKVCQKIFSFETVEK